MILLQADVLELKANPKAEASGVVIESQVDVGRGPLSTVIVQKGTLRTGDAIVCGSHWAKVRAMFDDQGRPIKEAPPVDARAGHRLVGHARQRRRRSGPRRTPGRPRTSPRRRPSA